MIALWLCAWTHAAELRDLPQLPQPLTPIAPLAGPPRELSAILSSLAQLPELEPASGPPAASSVLALNSVARELERPAPAADPALALEAFWTGARAAVPAGAVEPVKPGQEALVAEVVKTAWSSPTGRRVLVAAERLARRAGARVPVVVKALGNNYGEYDYIDKVLYINRDLARQDSREAAATLVHELVHVLQHARGVPAESLEMELEAHVITLDVLSELGAAPRPGTFSAAALRELLRGPEEYAAFVEDQLPGKLKLSGADFDDLAETLEQEADELQEKIDRLKDGPAKARAKARLAAVDRDLAIVRSPAGQKRCRDFAARVRRLIAKFHAGQVGRKPRAD